MTTLERPTTPAAAPSGSRRGWLRLGAVTVGAAGAAAVLSRVDPNHPGHYPTCPFLMISGLWCPGCGSLRAVHDLLHLDPLGALARNPLTVALVPVLLVAWGCWVLRLLGYRAPSAVDVPAKAIWVYTAVVMTFWVLRNLPGWTWLSPA